MPRAPRVCADPNCVTLTHTTRCPDHTKHGWGKGNPRTKDPRHEAWRKTVLTRDHWRCQIRHPTRCIGKANIADHIIAVAFGGPEYDPANGQAACQPCSDWKSSREGNQAQGHRIRP